MIDTAPTPTALTERSHCVLVKTSLVRGCRRNRHAPFIGQQRVGISERLQKRVAILPVKAVNVRTVKSFDFADNGVGISHSNLLPQCSRVGWAEPAKPSIISLGTQCPTYQTLDPRPQTLLSYLVGHYMPNLLQR